MTEPPAHEPPLLSPGQPQWSDDGTRWWDGTAWYAKDDAPRRQEELAREEEAAVQRAQAEYAQQYLAWQQQQHVAPDDPDVFVPQTMTPPPAPPPGLLPPPPLVPPSTATGYATGFWSFLSAMAGLLLWGLGGIAAVVLGHVSRSQAKRAHLKPNVWSRWGLFFGYLELTAGAVVVGILIWAGTGGLDDKTGAAQSLKVGAQAEELYHGAYGSYTSSLAPTGFRPATGVAFRVVHADTSSYCLRAAQGPLVLYLRKGGHVTHTPCT